MIHGTLVVVDETGVLLAGAPGVGKSRLALDLLQLGHTLVADDAIETRAEGHQLIGQCPRQHVGRLHLRHIGLINVERAIARACTRPSAHIHLWVDLRATTPQPPATLAPPVDSREVEGIEIPCLTLAIAAESNPALILQTAVRQWFSEPDQKEQVFE